MTKNVPIDNIIRNYCKSGFRLTFAVELLGIDVWHDCNEGILELGPCVQGLKLQYSLYPGQNYDLDILIWPHAAKVWCGIEYGWVRTWMFLNRRWLAFSIVHTFPVRVREFQNHVVSISPLPGVGNLSNNAKNDKNYQVLLPPLEYGELRYFAGVNDIDSYTPLETLHDFIENIIWQIIEELIPKSFLDETVDIPETVKDARHQDSVLLNVRESLLRRSSKEEQVSEVEEIKVVKSKDGKKAIDKEKEKKKGPETKTKFELKLTGDEILAGAGRVIVFNIIGDRSSELGEIMALISTANLPAQDDDPVFFVNIENLFQVPSADLKKLGIGQVYTKWKLGDEEHDSNPRPVKGSTEIAIKDHHALILNGSTAATITSCFLDDCYEIELWGVKNSSNSLQPPIFFGYDKYDRDFDKKLPDKSYSDDIDTLIAVTKIECRNIVKGISIFIGGEFPLFPATLSGLDYERPRFCTNDINSIGHQVHSNVVPSSIVLTSQMSLELTLGFVGCKPAKLSHSFTRMFALIKDPGMIGSILTKASELNKELTKNDRNADILTGIAIDTGDVVFLYIEGPRDGSILIIWELTEDFYPNVKPLFSSSARYLSRLYPDLLFTSTPITVYKMYMPLGALLACPFVYVHPALPLLTRSAVVKIGTLIASRLQETPTRSQMPTFPELTSFKLELCVPPRPMLARDEDTCNH